VRDEFDDNDAVHLFPNELLPYKPSRFPGDQGAFWTPSWSLKSLIQNPVLQPNSGQLKLIEDACIDGLAAILFTQPLA
jgi:hypothetical protein